MKLCIFSDIHGNNAALERMISVEAATTDLYIFLGDIWGYFYGQREIIDILMQMPNLVSIRGNHEQYYLDGSNRPELIERYGSSYEMNLSLAQKEYLISMPKYKEVVLSGKCLGLYHGGPRDYLEQRIYPNTPLEQIGLNSPYDFLLLGHTHYRLKERLGQTIVINPGSLGQPRDGNGFSYCTLDLENDICTFKAIKLDIKHLLQNVEVTDGDKPVYTYLRRKYGDE